MTAAPLGAVADSLLEAMHPGRLPRDVSGVYPTSAPSSTGSALCKGPQPRLSEAISALPGIVDGLRTDNIGDPVVPEQICDDPASELAHAALALDQSQAAADSAWQLTSRLYRDTDR